MSKASAIEFVKATEIDNVLLEKVKAADSPASVIKIAAENGYEFTELELLAVMKEYRSEDGELSEEVLEAVAGGRMQAMICIIGTSTYGLYCDGC